MTGTLMPYCSGLGCPDKLKCCRYKENIDFSKEMYLTLAPYSHIEKRCEFFVGDVTPNFLDHLKDLKNEKRRKN